MQIQLVNDDEAVEVAGEIERELLSSLHSLNKQSVNTSFVFSSRDADGKLSGGISASTSYGWLLIKTLWVAERAQRCGLGTRFVLKVEAQARELGCHGAWLDTSNAEARAFYRSLGYAEFGQLSNKPDQFPANHYRWFMKKYLAE